MILKIARFFLQNRAFSWFLLVLILGGGLFSYVKMGKLEDAPFTIKQAVVLTSYPGASPEEVREQVTDVLEESIQSLGELYYLKSDNRAGLSKITVYVKKEIRADAMQQLWDKLRRKVNDVQNKLPISAGPSIVNDDFGDVLGVFYGLSSESHSYRDLEDQAQQIKKEILKVKDVAKVELSGIQNRTIEVNVDPTLLTQRGVSVAAIAQVFEKQNKIVDAGAIETEESRLRVDATGSFTSLEEIENLTVVSHHGDYFRLGEIAKITESYVHPARSFMFVDQRPTIGIAISTVADGNVVNMAVGVKQRMKELQKEMPTGFSLTTIYDQGHESAVANDGFVMNLIISVLTVIAVLLFFIGFKNGILIGSGLIFSIFGTLIYMMANGIALQRMSLAAIIIAMGMLVDNAIVVYDLALINMQRGMRKHVAILRAVSSTALPLLAATLIAVLTFMPVYLSPHITGELLSSLFIVIAVSLLLSWILAISQYARNEWGNMAMKVRAEYDPYKAGRLNIGKADMMQAVKAIQDGVAVGVYREENKQVPVLLCSERPQEMNVEQLGDLPIWNGMNTAPLAQVSGPISLDWEYPLVRTYDRKLSMAAQCDVKPGYTMKEVYDEVREEIEQIRLPEGYSFFWDSQIKDQKEAMEALTKYFPLAILLLAMILIALFRNFKQPVIIFLILPLSLIGVVFGLLVSGFDFGFFCMAGWLGLLG